ncbi:MAG TPA: phosphatase PAP2 family protein [Gaiellaceae bacterium]|jgi:membrane-associated phospholipid phosphatase
MPWAQFGPHHLIQIGSTFKPDLRPTLTATLVSVWTFPASPPISALVVLLCAWVLPRREGIAVIGLWLVANGIELLSKLIVSRPSLGQPGFVNSFPSGHTVRAFVVAAVLAWTWRRIAFPAYAWALSVTVALVPLGAHVPTDVIGGALLAACLIWTTASVSAAGS